MIDRPEKVKRIAKAFRVHPAVILLGPRQCGKTTLARMFADTVKRSEFFDLERPADRRRLEAAELALAESRGLVVLDEAQRMPELFEVIRVLIDRAENRARFLLPGSTSPSLVRGISESLAGRVGHVDLMGFDLAEAGSDRMRRLWLRGGFPRSFLSSSEEASFVWREGFIRTFLERDIPQLGIRVPSETLRRFWTMIAHFHGQIWNAAEFARALGSSEGTARRYLDLLAGAYVVRVLPPWFENLKKRQVKAPKIFVRDSGILHALLGLERHEMLAGHPKVGASWEGFVVEQLLDGFGAASAYFWSTHAGAELDLLLTIRGKRHGFECKLTDAPASTKSMRVALDDLKLEHLWVVHPGSDRYPIDSRITALPADRLREFMREMKE